MNHAFIIQVHQFPELLRKSLKIMEAPNHYFFVHVDGKCNKKPFEKLLAGIKNVNIINNIGGIRVNHGGFSQIECTLNLLKTVTESNIGFDYVHSISGQDFPLCSTRK